MSRKTELWLVCGAIVGLSLVCAVAGRAQLASLLGPEKEALVYDGDVKTDSGGIQVTSWGSGEAQSVYEEVYVGPEVLKVTSQGPYQGIVLHLARPVELAEFLASKESYVDLRIRAGQVPKPKEEPSRARESQGLSSRGGTGGQGRVTGGGAGRGGPGGGGGRGGGGGGRRGGGGGRRTGWLDPGTAGDAGYRVVLTGGMGRGAGGGRRGGGGRGGRGGQAGRAPQQRTGAGQASTTPRPTAAGPQEKAFTLTRIRVALFTDVGECMADSSPVQLVGKDKRGWAPVMVPLSRFAGIDQARTLTAVGVYGDQADVFYLGRVRLVTDRTAVKATVKADPSVTFTDRVVEFTTQVAGLGIDPEVSWDFDDSDGIQKQAVGDKAKFIYKKAGDYLVTCTITDRAGTKQPLVQTIGVHVEGGATSAE